MQPSPQSTSKHFHHSNKTRCAQTVHQVPKTSFPEYKPWCLATSLPTLDPAEYSTFLETQKARAKPLAIRLQLKREYLLQYNTPAAKRPSEILL